MRYYGHRFERRDPDREKEYDEKHLADCREVKTYKLMPEEIKARYGDCKGQGEKASPLANIRNLGEKTEVDEMGKIYDIDETMNAVKATMEKLGITEHCLGARDIARNIKKYESTIYGPIGGMTGLADRLGLPTLAEYKKMKLKEFEEASKKVVVKEPEVVTMTTADALREVIEKHGVTVDEHEAAEKQCPVFAEYSKKVNECQKYMIELKEVYNKQSELQQEVKRLEIWLDGFEKAAELAGVSLE